MYAEIKFIEDNREVKVGFTTGWGLSELESKAIINYIFPSVKFSPKTLKQNRLITEEELNNAKKKAKILSEKYKEIRFYLPSYDELPSVSDSAELEKFESFLKDFEIKEAKAKKITEIKTVEHYATLTNNLQKKFEDESLVISEEKTQWGPEIQLKNKDLKLEIPSKNLLDILSKPFFKKENYQNLLSPFKEDSKRRVIKLEHILNSLLKENFSVKKVDLSEGLILIRDKVLPQGILFEYKNSFTIKKDPTQIEQITDLVNWVSEEGFVSKLLKLQNLPELDGLTIYIPKGVENIKTSFIWGNTFKKNFGKLIWL